LIGAQLLAASLGTIAMAIAKEVGYRTYALAELRRGAGYLVAVVVTSAVFVAAHVAGGVPWPAGVLVVGSASVMFAVIMLECGSLPLVAAMHATTNLVQDNVLRPTPDASLFSMRMPAPPSGDAELAIWLAIAGINLVVVAAVLAVRRGSSRPADTE
jgi:membrane protease YdiL (CAAX protease family)